MILAIANHNRYEFESAVPAQDIRYILNNINSQLIYMYGRANTLTVHPLGAQLNPIAMGPDQSYRLPFPLIDFQVDTFYPFTPEIKLANTLEGFQISVKIDNGFMAATQALLNFDEYMNLTHFSILFGYYVVNHALARMEVMNVLMHELPSLLGYIVCSNTRGRSLVTLGEPHEYTVRDDHSAPAVHDIGDVKQITNPRDNPTGITKRPHERAAHDRTLADGRVISVSPAIVHPEDYVPSNEPKNIKH